MNLREALAYLRHWFSVRGPNSRLDARGYEALGVVLKHLTRGGE